MPPPNDQRAGQILAAAAAVFTRSGFHAATIKDIAAEADTSQGLLYRYFAGKSDLVVALVESYVAQVHAAVERAETLAEAVDAALWMPDSDGHAEGALFVEVMAEALRNERVAEVVRQANTRVGVALADRVRAAQRSGEVVSGLDPDAVSEVLLALGDGLALRTMLADEPESPALRPTVDVLLTRFLRPATPPA